MSTFKEKYSALLKEFDRQLSNAINFDQVEEFLEKVKASHLHTLDDKFNLFALGLAIGTLKMDYVKEICDSDYDVVKLWDLYNKEKENDV